MFQYRWNETTFEIFQIDTSFEVSVITKGANKLVKFDYPASNAFWIHQATYLEMFCQHLLYRDTIQTEVGFPKSITNFYSG